MDGKRYIVHGLTSLCHRIHGTRQVPLQAPRAMAISYVTSTLKQTSTRTLAPILPTGPTGDVISERQTCPTALRTAAPVLYVSFAERGAHTSLTATAHRCRIAPHIPRWAALLSAIQELG